MHYCFYHVAQGNDVILKGKRSRAEKLNGCDVGDWICRADMNIQMTSDRWSRKRQPVGIIVHVFSFLAIFILSLMTLATEQTKNMFLLAER